MGWKCMDCKFQVLSIIYISAEYFIRFIYLENVIVIISSSHLIISVVTFFKKINVSLYYAPSSSCFVSGFCFLSAKLSAEMFVNLWAKTEGKLYWNIPLHTDTPSYCSYWGKTAYFVTFREAVIGRCSRKHLREEQRF